MQLERLANKEDRFAITFQFHKGAIRTREADGRVAGQPRFNSIKVQLELLRRARNQRGQQFQFHKGAIRTGNVGADYTCYTVVSIP